MTTAVAAPARRATSTTLRMVLVAAALLVSGLFVGTALHNALNGAWSDTVLACESTDPTDVGALLRCQAPAELTRAVWAVGGVAVLAVLAAGVVLVAPSIVRRRRRLVPAGPVYGRAVAAVGQMAQFEGLRPPAVLVGPFTMREPFCVGRPGAHQVALPPKLALLGNPSLFEVLVRHELAHLAHRDVGWSWLARSLWFVLAPLLAVPIVITAVRGEPGLALDIAWRSLALLGVVLLVVRQLMRAREHDADLAAARRAGVRQVLDGELSRRPPPPTGWRAALQWHPSPARRRQVLADPASAATLRPLDGVVLGFLAAVALPVVTGIVAAATLGSTVAGLAALGGAVLVGSLFGSTIGVGLWSHAAAAIPARRPGATRGVTFGVLGGAVLGQVAGLAGVGLGLPPPPVATPVALAAAAAFAGGLGELRVGRADPARPPAVRVPGAVLGATAAVALAWAGQQIQLAGEVRGWPLVAALLTTPGTLIPPLVAVVVLAGAAGWAVRPRAGGTTGIAGWPLVVAVGAGICGGGAIVAYRIVAGPPGTDDDALLRFLAVTLAAGLMSAVVTLVLGLGRGATGIGVALVAGPLATVITGLAVLGQVAVTGGDPLPIAGLLLTGALPLSLVLAAPAAVIGLVPAPFPRMTVSLVVVAAALAASVAATTVVQRAAVLPALPELAEPAAAGGGTTDAPPVLLPVPRDLYKPVVARQLLDRRVAEVNAFQALRAADPPAKEAAARIRAEILPLVEDLRRVAEATPLTDPVLLAVHAHAVTGAREHLQAFTLFAEALDAGDNSKFARAQQMLLAGDREWETWAAGVQNL